MIEEKLNRRCRAPSARIAVDSVSLQAKNRSVRRCYLSDKYESWNGLTSFSNATQMRRRACLHKGWRLLELCMTLMQFVKCRWWDDRAKIGVRIRERLIGSGPDSIGCYAFSANA